MESNIVVEDKQFNFLIKFQQISPLKPDTGINNLSVDKKPCVLVVQKSVPKEANSRVYTPNVNSQSTEFVVPQPSPAVQPLPPGNGASSILVITALCTL